MIARIIEIIKYPTRVEPIKIQCGQEKRRDRRRKRRKLM